MVRGLFFSYYDPLLNPFTQPPDQFSSPSESVSPFILSRRTFLHATGCFRLGSVNITKRKNVQEEGEVGSRQKERGITGWTEPPKQAVSHSLPTF